MSRRKQAKPRSLKRDEEWDDANEQNVLEASEQDNETAPIKPDDEDEEEEEELQRAFSRHSEDYLRDGRPSSVQGPDLENQNSLDSEALGTGSSSWHSEDGGPTSRRGGETPSSCATPTSASFPSEPEIDGEVGIGADGNNPTAPYPCQFCDRTFPRLSYLKKHEQSHGDQMPYRCSWCSRLFKHKRSRDRHVKLHTGDRRYRCSHCEAAFSRSDHLKIHMKTHDTQKPYQCTACSRGYNTAAALTSHMQSHKKHHQGTSNNGNKLQDSDYGRRSVSSHSTSSPPVPSSPSPSLNLSLNPKNTLKAPLGTSCSASTTPILNSPLKLACMYCTRDSFSCMQQLQMHVHTMHQAILSGENLVVTPSPSRTTDSVVDCSRDKLLDRSDGISKDQEKKYEERSTEKDYKNTFTCYQCTMKFSSLATLRDHLISIHRTDAFGTSLIMCPLCGIPCSSAAAYAEHYVLQHCENRRIAPQNPQEYMDPKLNGVYDTKSMRLQKNREASIIEPADLTSKHVKSSESNYTSSTLLCGQCGAALKDFESFREHLARHLQADHRNEAARFLCPKCETSFQDREDMLAHLTKHYLGQISKEYACSACKKLYPHPDLLQRHLLDSHAHHLYRCALCRDTFDSRVAIQVHFAVKHSQECRIYRCNACTAPNNENSPGNAPGEGRSFFRSEGEMANHVRNVHAPPALANNSPVARSPASTPGMTVNSGPRCVFCGIYCGSELELQLHLASHSTSLYRCPICREGFAVEFLLDRHIAQVHHAGEHQINARSNPRENGRLHRQPRSQEEVKSQKRGRSPASSNNNSLNQRDNNNKRPNFGVSGGQQCELCERGEFANEAELQAHKKLAHASSKVPSKSSSSSVSMTCAYCGEVCRSRNELESHMRMQHTSSEPGGRHKCNICDEVCPSGAILAEHKLQKHCKIQLSDTCVVCRGNLTTEALFLEHVQRHSLENVDPQQRLDNSLPHLPAPCVVCRQTLISDLECRLHARHHLRTSTSSPNTSSSPSPKQKPLNPSCCLCLREFSTEDFVNLPPNHFSGGQSLKVCKSCYVRYSQGLPILSSPYEHARGINNKCERSWIADKDLQWDGSGDRWDSDRGFKTEERSSINDQRADPKCDTKRCQECGVKFEDPEEAEKHKIALHNKTHDSGSNTYTCIQCQMSFPSEAMIQQHVTKEHLEASGKGAVDTLRCHLCIFEANSPLQLQSHLIEHTFAGCAALNCYICQALFTVPIALQNHMLQEHGLNARPYDCSKCTSKFFFKAELDHHVLMFHRVDENSALPETVKEMSQTKNQINSEDRKFDESVTIKEELLQGTEEEEDQQEEEGEEEEVNVDGQIEQERLDKEESEQKRTALKIEVDKQIESEKGET
uniref:zinc finger protein 423 homolog isoform X1 n=1 Tax=Vespula vulgaris TaxID=7454 RepID=UPI0021354844|nr:zinc finger protein 423 homolog isoform X1 [Vespula vulgaris]XP_050864704.1 zinc finger protein 423 homolog isoform X1 [Vespula vulgaris]